MLSYSSGPEGPLIDKTIGGIFRETAGLYRDRVALISVHQNVRLTYGQLCEAAEQVARALAGLGCTWVTAPGFGRATVWNGSSCNWAVPWLGRSW